MITVSFDKKLLHDYVAENRFKPGAETKSLSRCSDDFHEIKKKQTALTIPGGDAGDLAILYAAANVYGFEVDTEKASTVMKNIGKGHEHSPSCSHLNFLFEDPKAYNLEKDQLDKLPRQTNSRKPEKSVPGACVQITGPYGVYPQGLVEIDGHEQLVRIFSFHQSAIDARHRVIAHEMIEEEAVKLLPGLDEEYLYEVVSEMTEDHIYETARRLAKGVPLYEVRFEEDGGYKIEERGVI